MLANKTVDELSRLIPILTENIDLTGKSTKIINAVRLSKIIVKQLKKNNCTCQATSQKEVE
jgi:hypothetical protein